MTPHEFIAKWRPVTLSERSACQQHFLDLCELLNQPKPVTADPEGAVKRCYQFSLEELAEPDNLEVCASFSPTPKRSSRA